MNESQVREEDQDSTVCGLEEEAAADTTASEQCILGKSRWGDGSKFS